MTEHILSLHAGYEAGDSFVDGYVARPADSNTHPGLVVISGMGGLNWFQREITRTFAREGFVAVSPDLYDGVLPEGHATQLRYKNSLDIDRAIANICAGSNFLHSLPWVEDKSPIGVVGFCLGGGLALLALARSNAFGAGVIYYHSLFPDSAELKTIEAPMMCHYGTNDHTTPIEEIDAFRASLDTYNKYYELFMYEGVGHSFLNSKQDTSPLRANAAELSIQRSAAFFHKHLVLTKDIEETESGELEINK